MTGTQEYERNEMSIIIRDHEQQTADWNETTFDAHLEYPTIGRLEKALRHLERIELLNQQNQAA